MEENSENLDEKLALKETFKPVDNWRNPHEDGGGLMGLGTVSVVTDVGLQPSLILLERNIHVDIWILHHSR